MAALLLWIPLGLRAAEPVAVDSNVVLIARLGANSAAERDQAEAQLLQKGPAAREAVRSAMETETDPEITARLTRLWSRMRWMRLPGFDETAVAPLAQSFGTPTTAEAWDNALKKYGPALVRIAAELMQSSGQKENAARAFGRIAATGGPRSVAAVMAEDIRADSRTAEGYRELCRAASEAALTPPEAQGVAVVQLLLWWYSDALKTARESFRNQPSDEAVEIARAAISGGRLDREFWAAFAKLGEDRSSAGSARDWIFHLRIAFADRTPDPLRGHVPEGLGSSWNDTEVREATDRLLQMGLAGEAARLIGDSDRAISYFFRMRIARVSPGALAGERDPAVLRSKAIDAASSAGEPEAELYRLGTAMDEAGEPADDIWTLLLNRAAADSVYGANASLRMGRAAEKAGNITEAIAHYERALKAAHGTGAGMIMSNPGSKPVRGDVWLQDHIRELKQRPVEPPPAP